MDKTLKEKAMQQIYEYETKYNIPFYIDLENNIIQSIKKICTFAPHCFEDGYVKMLIPNLIDGYKEVLNSNDFIEKNREAVENNNYAEQFKTHMFEQIEGMVCENFAEMFFHGLGKGSIVKGINRFEKIFFYNKDNYEYFYLNSKEFSSLVDNMNEENLNKFKHNHIIKTSKRYVVLKRVRIFVFLPFFLIYIAIKNIFKKRVGGYDNIELLNDPKLIEIFIILEKTGCWQ